MFSLILILTNFSLKENVAAIIFKKQIFCFHKDENKKEERIVTGFSIIASTTLKMVFQLKFQYWSYSKVKNTFPKKRIEY